MEGSIPTFVICQNKNLSACLDLLKRGASASKCTSDSLESVSKAENPTTAANQSDDSVSKDLVSKVAHGNEILVLNSVQCWLESNNKCLTLKENSTVVETNRDSNSQSSTKDSSDDAVDIESTLLHHLCILPYQDSSEDLGQEKLFVSPTDSQLALKLAVHDQKMSTSIQPDFDCNDSRSIVLNEDSNSVLTVELNKFGSTPDAVFLEKLLSGTFCNEDMSVFKEFLDQNNKYDLLYAINYFIEQKTASNDGLSTVVLLFSDETVQLHPLEHVALTHLGSKFDIGFFDGKSMSSDFDLNGSENKAILDVPQMSSDELALFSAWTSYLTILVNSRCELSLARTLNVPDRELSPSVFKALRNSAREKEMPMFQTALSFITQVRLGGKGYKPKSKSPIFQHVKGLGDYVDFVDKLRSHLENYEITPKLAIKRVLLTLQKEFMACKKSIKLKPYVDRVYQEMWTHVKQTCALNVTAPSPKTPNSGGTLAGRDAFKLLHKLVIKFNILHSIRSIVSLNYNSERMQLNHTPILNVFKSPAPSCNSSATAGLNVACSDFNPDVAEEAVAFADDLKTSGLNSNRDKVSAPTTPKNLLKVSRKSQEINWAKTPETPFLRASEMEMEDSSHVPLEMENQSTEDECASNDDLEKTLIGIEELPVEEGVAEHVADTSIVDVKCQPVATNETMKPVLKDKKTVAGQKRKSSSDQNCLQTKYNNCNLSSTSVIKKSKSSNDEIDKPKVSKKETSSKPVKAKANKKQPTVPSKGQKTIGMFFK